MKLCFDHICDRLNQRWSVHPMNKYCLYRWIASNELWHASFLYIHGLVTFIPRPTTPWDTTLIDGWNLSLNGICAVDVLIYNPVGIKRARFLRRFFKCLLSLSSPPIVRNKCRTDFRTLSFSYLSSPWYDSNHTTPLTEHYNWVIGSQRYKAIVPMSDALRVR